MRRTDLLASIQTLRDALASSNIRIALHSIFRRGEVKLDGVLPSLNAYSIKAAGFDDATRQLTAILGIDILSSAKVWDKVFDTDVPLSHQLFTSVRLAEEYLPKFADLLKQRGVNDYLVSSHKSQQTKEDVDVISVILLGSV